MGTQTALWKLTAWTQILLLSMAAAFGQSASANTQAAKIREQVDRVGALGTITVNMRDGREYYGTVGRIDPDEFTVNEVDLKRELTIRYQDVRRVRSGYGTTRGISGRRIHPHTRLIVGLAVVGGLLALVFIAVASDHS